MSMVQMARAGGRACDASRAPSQPLRLAAIVGALSFLILLAFGWATLETVWKTGAFFDPDDAMRMVQVRDFLAGQSWYDLTQWRVDAPHGVFMHWSRVVDVPIILLVDLFTPFAAPAQAERLARIAYSLLMQIAMIGVVIGVARQLAGTAAIFTAGTLLALSGLSFGQFQPGRIDHHSAQNLLLVCMIGGSLAALDARRAWRAMLAGLAIALSLAISMENMPFIAPLAALLPVVWIVQGARSRAALLWFGASLLVFLPLAFVATIGPARWTLGTCDAYSTIQLIAGCTGGLLCIALALASDRLCTMRARLVAASAAGIAFAAVALLVVPACFSDPFSHMDPVVMQFLMPYVAEARPLHVFLQMRPWFGLVLVVLPVLVSLFGGVWLTLSSQGIARVQWAAIVALLLVGIALTFWEIRVTGSVLPLAILCGAGAAARIAEAGAARKIASLTMLSLAAALPFAQITYAMAAIPLPDDSPRETASARVAAACRTPEALDPLRKLGTPGVLLAPMEAGAHMLATTQLSVLGASYHRNNHGNRAALDIFRALPRDAEAMMRAAQVRYVAICPGLGPGETSAGLGAALAAGDVPDWLAPVPDMGAHWRVFAFRP